MRVLMANWWFSPDFPPLSERKVRVGRSRLLGTLYVPINRDASDDSPGSYITYDRQCDPQAANANRAESVFARRVVGFVAVAAELGVGKGHGLNHKRDRHETERRKYRNHDQCCLFGNVSDIEQQFIIMETDSLTKNVPRVNKCLGQRESTCARAELDHSTTYSISQTGTDDD